MNNTPRLFALVLITIAAACGPAPDQVSEVDPDALACCECLAETEFMGSACIDLEPLECALDLKDGATPGEPRCYVGGGQMCSDVCGAIYYRNADL